MAVVSNFSLQNTCYTVSEYPYSRPGPLFFCITCLVATSGSCSSVREQCHASKDLLMMGGVGIWRMGSV